MLSFFLWLSNSPLYIRTVSSLSIHLSMDTQVASMSWLLWPVLLWISGCMDLSFLKRCVLLQNDQPHILTHSNEWYYHFSFRSLLSRPALMLWLIATLSFTMWSPSFWLVLLGQPAGLQITSQWLASNCLLETTVRFSLQYKYSQEQYSPIISVFNVTCGLEWHGMPVASGELWVLSVGTFVPECWLMLKK